MLDNIYILFNQLHFKLKHNLILVFKKLINIESPIVFTLFFPFVNGTFGNSKYFYNLFILHSNPLFLKVYHKSIISTLQGLTLALLIRYNMFIYRTSKYDNRTLKGLCMVYHEFNGEKLSTTKWAQRLGISAPSFRERLLTWSDRVAIFTKTKQYPTKRKHICLECNKEFDHRNGENKNMFCSRQCYGTNSSNRIQYINSLKTIEPKVYVNTCRQCNKEFKTTDRYKIFICSDKCNQERSHDRTSMFNDSKILKYISIAKPKLCIVCNGDFLATKGSKKTCSIKCSNVLERVQKNNSNHRRRERKVSQSDGTVNALFMLAMRKVKKCYWCNTNITPSNYSIDHIQPISKGGSHSSNNIVVACRDCNSKKRDIDPISFANSIGKLL